MEPSLAELFKNISGITSSAAGDWGSIHPLVIHFPIVLLFIVPFFILAGLIFQKSSKILFISALALMLFGTASLYLATSTGDAAAENLKPDPAVVSTLDHHVQLGEQARLNFSVLSGIFLFLTLLRSKITQKSGNKFFAVICVFLAAYIFNLIILYNAAHYGGRLVHRHGIHSTMYTPKGNSAVP